MDYRNLESTEATIASYLGALKQIYEYCPNLEPSANEYNRRVALPTDWRPFGGVDSQKLHRDANYLYATHASLLEYGKARYIAKGYWDYDAFFKVSWQLQIPFNLYAWECGHTHYPDGYDVEDNPIGEPQHTPPTMKEWCSPQYIKLGEISSWAMKSWALPDWWQKHKEIESFMDDNPILKDKYRLVVEKADKEVTEWQKALGKMKDLSNIFD